MNASVFKISLASAIAAARDFKQLLDIQAPNTLFFPNHKGDARTTEIYKQASRLIEQAATQNLKATEGVCLERCITLPLPGVVAQQGADIPPNQLQLFAGVTAAIAELAFQVLDEYRGSSEYSSSLEIIIRTGSKGNMVLEEVKSEGDAVHESHSQVVIGQPLCHGANSSSEAH